MAMSRQKHPTVFHPAGYAATAALGMDMKDVFIYEDDFFDYYDTTAAMAGYAETGDSPNMIGTDAAGGILSIETTATPDNDGYISNMREIFSFTGTKRLTFEVWLKHATLGTITPSLIVGLSDTVAADSMLADGTGPMITYTGAVFFKAEDGTVWQFETSSTTNQNTSSSVCAFTDDTYQILRFEYMPTSATTATVTPYTRVTTGSSWVKGTTLAFETSSSIIPTTPQLMHLFFGIRTHEGTAEFLFVDYVRVVQER